MTYEHLGATSGRSPAAVVASAMEGRCLYMGAWGKPGMYLRRPDGGRTTHEDDLVEYYRRREVHVDSTLAPRTRKYGRQEGNLLWTGVGATGVDRQRLGYDSEECPQGQFFRHFLDSGFTAIAWWDRTQGDSRGGVNSIIFLEGDRPTWEVMAALDLHFPRVLVNLGNAGVGLVELPLP